MFVATHPPDISIVKISDTSRNLSSTVFGPKHVPRLMISAYKFFIYFFKKNIFYYFLQNVRNFNMQQQNWDKKKKSPRLKWPPAVPFI